MMPKIANETSISIAEIHRTDMEFHIVGESPLVPHAMSAKNALALLIPPPKKNATEKATMLKHEPLEEFRAAAYCFKDADNTETRLYMKAACFHAAMGAAAIDMIGVKKAQVLRLTSVLGDKIPIYGVPEIWSTIVRSSDMNRTPDVRTLPILPHWACCITVRFVASLVKEQSVGNLLGAAGIMIGIGDGRPEKGKLDMGRFRVCTEDDEEYLQIIKQGKALQDAALADPRAFDDETEKLLAQFEIEKKQRFALPPTVRKTRRSANDGAQRNELRPT